MNTGAYAVLSGDKEEHFDPDRFLINVVRRAVANQQDVEIGAGADKIWVLAESGEYHARVGDMEKFCAAPVKGCKIKILSRSEVNKLTESYGRGRNIDELMWQTGFYASGGRLMKGCKRDDVVAIRQWPNLTRLPITPHAIQLIELLVRHPTSITLASRLLKIPLSEVYRLYTAAHCAGIAKAINRRPQVSTASGLRPHRNQGLLGQVLGRIAGI